MKKAAKWIMRLKACVFRAGRTSIFRLCKPRLLAGCVALLCGPLLAGLAQAVPIDIDAGDILVADGSANRLIRVDGETGVRSVISDFSNPAQGPVGGPDAFVDGVAIGRGQIFVTDGPMGIFLVDPRTGHRTLVSDFSNQGILTEGVAIDAFGRVVATLLQVQGFPFQSGVVRVAPRTDTRVIVTDLPYPEFITDLTLEHPAADHNQPGGAILIGTTNLNLAGHSAIYRVDPVTGNRSLLSDSTNPAQGTDVFDLSFSHGLAVEHSGTILANSGRSGLRNLLLRINPVSGNRRVLSDFDNRAQGPLGANLVGAAVQNSGQIIVAATDPTTGISNLFRVNAQTGRRVLFSDSTNPRQGPSFKGGFTYIAVVPHSAGFHERDDEPDSRCAPPPADSFTSPFGLTR